MMHGTMCLKKKYNVECFDNIKSVGWLNYKMTFNEPQALPFQ